MMIHDDLQTSVSSKLDESCFEGYHGEIRRRWHCNKEDTDVSALNETKWCIYHASLAIPTIIAWWSKYRAAAKSTRWFTKYHIFRWSWSSSIWFHLFEMFPIKSSWSWDIPCSASTSGIPFVASLNGIDCVDMLWDFLQLVERVYTVRRCLHSSSISIKWFHISQTCLSIIFISNSKLSCGTTLGSSCHVLSSPRMAQIRYFYVGQKQCCRQTNS